MQIKNIHKKIIRSIFNCVSNKLAVALIDKRLNSNSFKFDLLLSVWRNMKKRKYNLTIYLAYVFLFPLYIFGIVAKFYDSHIYKKKPKSSLSKEKEDMLF